MDIFEAIEKRRSVRVYRDTPIEEENKKLINDLVANLNEESGQHFQVFYDEPTAFTGVFAYSKLINVKNYIVIVGKKGKGQEEICGYYGEKLVIFLQTLGINTCWAGISYKKRNVKAVIEKGEKLYLLIAMGYGKHLGHKRKSKTFEEVTDLSAWGEKEIPDWFKKGIEYALLAPTAINQQKFCFKPLANGEVELKKGVGFYSKTDIGIVKYHFEIGALPKKATIIIR
ncbi:MAG: nitroreductase [Clostridia bacterium]|nr:nitroreductase [Clostridia bacterium]